MRAEDRKQLILKCAKKLFAEYGFHGTQISDIIKEAKIARGTIYQYFKNKEDIFITLLDNYFSKWKSSVNTRSNEIDISSISPIDFFRFRIKSALIFFANDHDLCNIMLRIGTGLRGDLQHATARIENNIIELIIKDLNFGKKNNAIQDDLDVNTTAYLLSGAVHNLAYQYFVLKKKSVSEFEIEYLTDQITHVFGPGLFLSKKL